MPLALPRDLRGVNILTFGSLRQDALAVSPVPECRLGSRMRLVSRRANRAAIVLDSASRPSRFVGLPALLGPRLQPPGARAERPHARRYPELFFLFKGASMINGPRIRGGGQKLSDG